MRTVYLSIKAGEADMGLAVGAEQMGKMGLLGAVAQEGDGPPGVRAGGSLRRGDAGRGRPRLGARCRRVFAQAGMEYAYQHDGVGFEQFAKVAEKNHAHSTLNPLAQYQKAFSLEEIMNARDDRVPEHAADVLPDRRRRAPRWCSCRSEAEDALAEQQRRAVKIGASVLTSDPWTERGQVQPDVNTLTRNAAKQAYETAGIGPDDLDLVELHDCFATAELLHYDNLGLCEPGGAGDVHRLGRDRGATGRSR